MDIGLEGGDDYFDEALLIQTLARAKSQLSPAIRSNNLYINIYIYMQVRAARNWSTRAAIKLRAAKINWSAIYLLTHLGAFPVSLYTRHAWRFQTIRNKCFVKSPMISRFLPCLGDMEFIVLIRSKFASHTERFVIIDVSCKLLHFKYKNRISMAREIWLYIGFFYNFLL